MLHVLTFRVQRARVWANQAYDTAHYITGPVGAEILVELSKAQEHLSRAATLLAKMREH